MRRRIAVGLLGAICAFVVGGCEFAPATPSPRTPAPSAVGGLAPAISISQNWTVIDGIWTFSGGVDPRGSPTRVVLEIGPGPQTSRVFDREIVAAEGILDAGPVSAELTPPDLREFCVRFTATNEAGSGSTSPFCVSTELPGMSQVIVGSPEPSGG